MSHLSKKYCTERSAVQAHQHNTQKENTSGKIKTRMLSPILCFLLSTRQKNTTLKVQNFGYIFTHLH